jgi:energy-coupling factor transporter transmembrane protein EcfT
MDEYIKQLIVYMVHKTVKLFLFITTIVYLFFCEDYLQFIYCIIVILSLVLDMFIEVYGKNKIR